MSVVCGSCRNENRDGAKFCKGCGQRLVSAAALKPASGASPVIRSDWPDTDRMPLRTAAPPVPASRALPAPPAAPAKNRSADRKSGPGMTGVVGLLLAVALAGGAGWYAYSKRTVAVAPAGQSLPVVAASPVPVPAPAPVPPAAAPMVSQTPVVETAVPAPAPPEEPVAPLPAPAPPPQAEAAKPVAAVARKPRKPPPPAAPAAVPQPAAATPPSIPPPPLEIAAAPASPATACAGQGFFARARCMAAQCARDDLRSHAQCDAVRRQQKVDEERRNPSLLN